MKNDDSLAKQIDDYIWLSKENDENILFNVIFNGIIEIDEVLKEASNVVKDKFGNRDTFKYNYIVEEILKNKSKVKKEIYEDIKNKIIGNNDLERIVLEGYSNGGDSFLLHLLNEKTNKFTPEQKKDIINAAMMLKGSKKYNKKEKDRNKKNRNDINQNNNILEDDKGLIIAFNEYFSSNFDISLSQAHGVFPFDLRFYILTHPEFKRSKKRLIYEFYAENELYNDLIYDLNCNIINLARSKEMRNLETIYNFSDYNEYDKKILYKYLDNEPEKLVYILERIAELESLLSLREEKYEDYNSMSTQNEKVLKLKK